MSARLEPQPTLRPIGVTDLDAVMAIEQRAYSFPWSRGNFIDSLAAGYAAQMLLDGDGRPIGYFVAMPGVDEMHLLNLTVDPHWQGRGLSHLLMDAVDACCDERHARVARDLARAGEARAAEAQHRDDARDPRDRESRARRRDPRALISRRVQRRCIRTASSCSIASRPLSIVAAGQP